MIHVLQRREESLLSHTSYLARLTRYSSGRHCSRFPRTPRCSLRESDSPRERAHPPVQTAQPHSSPGQEPQEDPDESGNTILPQGQTAADPKANIHLPQHDLAKNHYLVSLMTGTTEFYFRVFNHSPLAQSKLFLLFLQLMWSTCHIEMVTFTLASGC